MALTEKDLKAMQVLFQQEMEPLRKQIDNRFAELSEILEGLATDNEKCEHEYLVLTGQVSLGKSRAWKSESKVLIRAVANWRWPAYSQSHAASLSRILKLRKLEN